MTHLPLARYKTDARDFTRATGLEPADVPSVVDVFSFMMAVVQSRREDASSNTFIAPAQATIFKRHFDLVRLNPRPFIPVDAPIPEETYTGIVITLLSGPLNIVPRKIRPQEKTSLQGLNPDTALQRGIRNCFNARKLLLANQMDGLDLDTVEKQTALLFTLSATSDVLQALESVAGQPCANSNKQRARRDRIERLQHVLFKDTSALARIFQQRYYDLLRLEAAQAIHQKCGFPAPQH